MRRFTYRVSTACLILAIGFMIWALPSRAARDLGAVPKGNTHYELLVLEVSHCLYCQLFRRDVVPTYKASAHAGAIPMRFIDLDRAKLDAFQLSGPVETLPTVILLHRYKEVGRVSGHVGPEIFLHVVGRMLSAAP